MTDTLRNIERRIAEFERRQQPAGRLESYAISRVNHTLLRQSFNVVLVSVLFVTGNFAASFATLALLLLGELVDTGYLASVPRQIARGGELRKLYRTSAFTAGFQSVTVASAALIPFAVSEAPAAVIACFAYLCALSINAGFLIRHHPSATHTRLGIYLAATALIVVIQARRNGFAGENMIYNATGMILMLFVVYAFVRFALSGYSKQLKHTRDLLIRSKALARANKELEAQQDEIRRLALVAQHASDSIFVSDAEGRILWANPAFFALTGYCEEEAIGKTPSALLNGPNTDMAQSHAISEALRDGMPLRTEILNQSKDGREYWVETNQVPVLDKKGQVEMVIAIERDITKAKDHAEELAAAKHAAEEGERAKSQFLATMSHEIRTPMNGIIGMADLLREAKLPKEQAGYVETIRFSAEALMRIINDILDFSKLDAGKSVICPVDFDLLACIEGALSILRPKAIEKKIFIDLDCVTPVPRSLRGDDGRIRQIIINIVGNAIKFTHEGGITLRLSCVSDSTGHQIRLAVRDTGIGIAPDRLASIFDEFNQADGEITRQYGGTGLGLTISRILAQEMGGDIEITSELGKGSEFVITLALEHAAEPIAEEPNSTAPINEIKLDGIKALVAEDNRTNQLIMQKYLKDTGLDVVYAENGREAVKLTRRHTPRIVFMDMSMPEMDGIAATREIRASEGLTQPTIVALTANVYASDKAACLSAGMDGFLSKPLKRSDLMSWLARL